MPLADEVDLDEVAGRTERYTGADLYDAVRRAGLVALRRSHDVERVKTEDFDAALAESGASVTPEMESEYEHIRSSLGHEGPLRRPIGFRPAAAAE